MLEKLKEIAQKVQTEGKEQLQEPQEQKKGAGIKYKQAEFLSLLRSGKSITNIKIYNNWTSDDLVEIITDDFIIECNKIDPQFGKIWERWKEKYM